MRTFAVCLNRSSFPIPLQLLYTESDPMGPPEIGLRDKAMLPNADLVWLKDTSHFAHVDAVVSFTAAVLPFLRGSG